MPKSLAYHSITRVDKSILSTSHKDVIVLPSSRVKKILDRMTQKSRSRVANFPVFFAQSAIALRKNGWADNHVVGPRARRMHTTKHNTHSRHNTSGVCLCRELVGQRTVFVVFVQCCNSTKKRKEKGGYVCLVAKDQASLFSCSVNQNNKNKSARAAEQTKLKTQDSKLSLSCCKLLCPLHFPHGL